MGADDSNQGTDPDECPGHDWVPAGLTLASDGAYLEHACRHCGTPSMQTPTDLSGPR